MRFLSDGDPPLRSWKRRGRMPETIGLLILSAIGVADFVIIGTVTLSAVIGAVAIAAVAIGLQMLLAKGMPKQDDGSQALRQTIPARIGAYGRVRLGGRYMLYEEHNGVSLDILALVGGKITGFEKYFLNDDEVTLAVDGVVQAGTDGRYGKGLLQIRTRLGEATETAYPEVVDVLAGDVWTNDHRGDGIASAMLRCTSTDAEEFQEIYPHGLPQPSFVIAGYAVWDPRDAGQSRADPSTWVFSTNPVLQLLDYLTHPDHGMALDYDTLIAPVIDEWAAEADLCDALVARVSGSHKRYESNGWFTFDTKPEDVIGSLLSTCDGWMAERGDGTLAIKVGVYRGPNAPTIKAKHVLAFTASYGVPDEERVNELTLSFISPDHDYKDTPLTPWRDEDDISESGRVRSQALSMGWVQSYPQVRRLAKRAMARLKPTLRGSIVTTLYGLVHLGERWVRVQYPTVSGLEDAVVEIQKADIDLMAGRITFEWVKIDPDTIDAWTPATEEGPPPPEPEKLTKLPFEPPENVYAFIANNELIITLDNDGGQSAFRTRWRPVGQTAWIDMMMQSATDDDVAGRWVYNAGIIAVTDDFEVQVARVASMGTASEWADATVWTPAVLGAALLGCWDAERSDLITHAGGAVSSWKDTVAAYDMVQATSGSQPVYNATAFNGRPALIFDGVDDYLNMESQPFQSGSQPGELWGLVDQAEPTSNTTIRRIIAFGREDLIGRAIRRIVQGGVNRTQVQAGNGTLNFGAVNTSVDLSGRHVVRGTFAGTGIRVAVDSPVLSAETSLVPATDTTRVRIGVSAANSPVGYWSGSIAFVAVTDPLTDLQASSFARYLRGRT